MATQATGIVQEVKAKATKFGDMYDVVINGTAYGHGKFPPRGIQAGDFVTFEFETKQNGQWTNHNIVPKSLRKDSSPAPAAVDAAKAETRQVVQSADKRQETISKQANLNSALQLINAQINVGGVKFPAAAKAPDIFKAVEGLVLDQAARFYKLTTGEDWKIDVAVDKPQAAGPKDDEGYPYDDLSNPAID